MTASATLAHQSTAASRTKVVSLESVRCAQLREQILAALRKNCFFDEATTQRAIDRISTSRYRLKRLELISDSLQRCNENGDCSALANLLAETPGFTPDDPLQKMGQHLVSTTGHIICRVSYRQHGSLDEATHPSDRQAG